ncbi:hypothetical protein GCM10020331_055880 [Ectobacillus funiculus]
MLVFLHINFIIRTFYLSIMQANEAGLQQPVLCLYIIKKLNKNTGFLNLRKGKDVYHDKRFGFGSNISGIG